MTRRCVKPPEPREEKQQISNFFKILGPKRFTPIMRRMKQPRHVECKVVNPDQDSTGSVIRTKAKIVNKREKMGNFEID
jgi:hypothetical protein